MELQTLQDNVAALVTAWMPARPERMARQALDKADFKALAEAGFTLMGVPCDRGGLWNGPADSARPLAMLLRKLATVDPSLALVASMHPTILLLWMPDPLGPVPDGWREQQEFVFEVAKTGHWFGTIASEPGIGGDINATKATAKQGPDGTWHMTGDKFMGSGSGVTSFMMTLARPEGEDRPEAYLLDTRELAWDGSQGLKLVRPWDGIGMAATQSHAFRFDDVPVTRHGMAGGLLDVFPNISPIIGFMFSAVITGILDAASAEAKVILGKKAGRLSAFEQVQWVEAENQIWLAQQAFDGMARAMGTTSAADTVLHGKLAIGDLAEKAMAGLSHALGGSSLSRSSPFAQWTQDVRALGHLRPPRALSYTRILEGMAQ
jgi:alkylation response protein AidB-like acyl-CoA dehydrogenase